MDTKRLLHAVADHSRHVGARLMVQAETDRLTDEAIKTTLTIAEEFRVASACAPFKSARQQQLLDRVRVCLDVLANVEEDLMLAAGER